MNKNRIQNYITVCAAALFIGGFSLWSVFAPDRDISSSERRPLAQFPEYSDKSGLDAVLDGSFMKDFESWSLDQFPLRDEFRTLKSAASFYVMRKLDNNDIYVSQDYASKLEYPLDGEKITHAAERFRFVYDTCIKDSNAKVYLSVIPDKNYFLAEQGGYPALDYEKLVADLTAQTDFAQYIDIFPLMELEDYYKTDTHWRQEKILKAARKLASEMDTELTAEYSAVKLDEPFYGVYYGQSALPLPAEDIFYLENDVLKNCVVTDYETNKQLGVYDLEKAGGQDPYEIFLSGPKSLMTIENPAASTNKELVIFRDSFGSSLAPLFAEGYAKITVVDIRYMAPQMLSRFIKFDDQDVLFIYSTLVLNNSETIK